MWVSTEARPRRPSCSQTDLPRRWVAREHRFSVEAAIHNEVSRRRKEQVVIKIWSEHRKWTGQQCVWN